MTIIIDGKYKIKTEVENVFGKIIKCKRTIGYRQVQVNNEEIIEEGIIIKGYYKNEKENYKLSLNKTVFSYLSFYNTKEKKLLCGIRGKNDKWMFVSESNHKWLNSKKEALVKFLETLYNTYKIYLVIKNSEIF
jgi:hypothetical protein